MGCRGLWFDSIWIDSIQKIQKQRTQDQFNKSKHNKNLKKSLHLWPYGTARNLCERTPSQHQVHNNSKQTHTIDNGTTPPHPLLFPERKSLLKQEASFFHHPIAINTIKKNRQLHFHTSGCFIIAQLLFVGTIKTSQPSLHHPTPTWRMVVFGTCCSTTSSAQIQCYEKL